MKLSIVTGTYNRLPLLQAMLESCRKSVGNLEYEIILVDGGSTDGTLTWVRGEKNVRLIEQGELLGAVKAFHAGIKIAKGEYVALLNDDIEVEGNSLRTAVDHLENNPQVGQIAFYHRYMRRAGGTAPPQIQGAFDYIYGQCTVLRKWLGDQAGWWGDYHTYAGDTQLSLMLWVMGHEVVALEGCVVTDREHNDQLRTINNERGRPDGRVDHSDSIVFMDRWRAIMPKIAPKRDKWQPVTGPWLSQKAQRGILRTLRYKITPPGWIQRTGMIRAFARLGVARQINQTSLIEHIGLRAFQDSVVRECERFCPDLVIFQAHGDDNVQLDTIRYLRERCDQTIFANFLGDLHYPLGKFDFEVSKAVHCQLMISPTHFEEYRKNGANNVAWWPIGYEPEYAAVTRPENPTGPDVIFMGNSYRGSARFPESTRRHQTAEEFAKSGLNFALFGLNWQGVRAQVTQNMDKHSECARLYAEAKMTFSISQSSTHWGYSSDRLYCAAATGVPVLVQRFAGMEEHGFIPGENCLTFTEPQEAVQVAREWLKKPRELWELGMRGREMVLERHNYDRRAEQLLAILDIGNICGC